ncbi:bifunctional methionine sulfoxide reductase B/A protein (plasmid) [Legionella adelaidensis]|uniref:Peptide methionine sulfoxide reductase MsrA n=1 Tax=Legionella adelaidensis TaxID=45056 RepID=A0A0W0R0L8_9GAMM|nr:bifunctional methionine sulfoxide reductase B/A protein [Legionella adelaidensis]KTC64643.1 bifunctional methionine sulfoxide reductase B/A protein [Legionella adelaidensis]VEH86111.1 bifunctional methionine sulfoxide reductase B/A protein [Legionella adelaidensis]
MPFLDKLASLTPFERKIICDKATEYAHIGKYNAYIHSGTYLCRRCGLALFRADSQFSSGCGWPSFDVTIPHAVKEVPDADGLRIEILCSRCLAHLGHVFTGEGFTPLNRRFCVNSTSLDFVNNQRVTDTEEAILAGGCFWGVDYYLKQLTGVLKVEVGYTGGSLENPSYEQICQGHTGHYEAVRIIFDKEKIDYQTLVKYFLEIHDPTQKSGQGPDMGHQYKSAIFYYNEKQKAIAQDLLKQLSAKNYEIATQLLPVTTFWIAEDYHQDYYFKHKKTPYCHKWVKRF